MTVLHDPFIISSALAPALKIGEATLTLLETEITDDNRDRAVFELQTPTFTHTDKELRSGIGGFPSAVEAFESYLSFLEAAAESYPDGENADLFPPHVVQWACENADEIGMARSDLCDENGHVLTNLIEE